MGWYDNEECTGNAITSITVTSEKTYYAKWQQSLKLTLNKNNGTKAEVVEFAFGTTPEIKTPTKGNEVFMGWYTNEECTIEYVSENKTEDVTLYAKWYENAYFVGQFWGYNSDHDGVGKKDNSTTLSKGFAINPDGTTSGKSSEGWKLEDWDNEKGILLLKDKSKIQFVTASDGTVFLITDFHTGKSYPCDDDFNIYVKASETIIENTSTNVSTIYWLNGYEKVIKFTIGEKIYYFYSHGYNASSNPEGCCFYVDVKFTNSSNENISFDDIYANSKFIDILNIKDSSGNVVAYFGGDGTKLVFNDNKEGTYTGTINGINSKISLNGFGKSTIKVGEGDSTTSAYKLETKDNVDKIFIEINEKEYEFVLGSENTFSQVLDGFEGTYSL